MGYKTRTFPDITEARKILELDLRRYFRAIRAMRSYNQFIEAASPEVDVVGQEAGKVISETGAIGKLSLTSSYLGFMDITDGKMYDTHSMRNAMASGYLMERFISGFHFWLRDERVAFECLYVDAPAHVKMIGSMGTETIDGIVRLGAETRSESGMVFLNAPEKPEFYFAFVAEDDTGMHANLLVRCISQDPFYLSPRP
ncbi:MAG: hypothetical protein HY051_04740 [Candidatus Aenigmarchaeota archaeon]|nr:hypothetical protein [Candidatus Aenigmarchaeota archaeon]